MNKKYKLLAVDDEAFNLDIMTEYLTAAGHDVFGASDGVQAMAAIEAHPDIDLILLDRMMPHMDGMAVLQQLNTRQIDIPVIMQTAAAQSHQILEGIQAGVFYYLTKPYDEALLLSVVKATLRDTQNKKALKEEVRLHKRVLGMMTRSQFHFKTLTEAKNIAYFMACFFPDPQTAICGLNEVLINAVEHGNLGITYAEKTKLVLSGTWNDEVERRLCLPENQDKFVDLSFELKENCISVCVADQGNGFNWKNYMEMAADRATDPHGRGIAISKMLSFDEMEYIGCGNQVICRVKI